MPDIATKNTARRRFTVTGQVQGVGFRPFVFRLAHDLGLTGSVRNTPEGVAVEVQGTPEAVEVFGRDLQGKLPPLARIVGLTQQELEPEAGEQEFRILASTAGHGHQVLISSDTATCADCLADMRDPSNRRNLYPFTNCTNCGPRYTITRSIPYDRATTSMACFPLCDACRAEYENPLDRRFHAQPNACPECGPKVWLTDKDGRTMAERDEAMRRLAEALAEGLVCAIKGLGGFHLACDATSAMAVAALRERKNRRGKPLAVMVPNLDTARRLAEINAEEERWLTGKERPIVLLRRRPDSPLAADISPDTQFIGVMLPYTPLHHVLFHHLQGRVDLPALVMTSGNFSSEPISIGNREALRRLADIADLFLLHDRDILIRTDDSVLRVLPTGKPQFLRRARGFTPTPIFLAGKNPSVLGLGPELKNTLCVTKDDQAFVSQHIGDMENLETLGFHHEIRQHLVSILQISPVALVRDLHPDYLTTAYALEQRELPVLTLQHHFAHAFSVLAEHRHQGPALALALDGTGFGEDGTLWGGEALFVDTQTLERKRLGHFAPAPLPGGETAIREPWRIAQAYLWACGITTPDKKPWPWLAEHAQASAFVARMLERDVNCPRSTSCGRLFDAVSALLGIKLKIDYEGQAAILLEQAQDQNVSAESRGYACPLLPSPLAPDESTMLDTLTLFRAVHEDFQAGVPTGIISRRFHLGLVAGLAELAAALAERTGVRTVALSGGVMLNLTMSTLLPDALDRRGLVPLSHEQLPPGDACISLGQAAWGRRAVELGLLRHPPQP
ncbi:carbamoyltransferase HypF [Desulfocurvibacter africanus]|uniref:Carbamoyltransferase n=1 Tax=Desulfocurvibacter africanus subsp. africanus str. Walvis Bay TaxID=690850 RepID=F3YVD3_DESAF|nr:carbamoyltransferase HypF [Desulfocurvibacter africanus]EGJ48525.1 Acylphosphatase [Desulfocurvibacter africanus subsp. africanus str. Walvis Bay]